jgi:putative effector of murein hydrolase LrgA (UPF0299 family)
MQECFNRATLVTFRSAQSYPFIGPILMMEIDTVSETLDIDWVHLAKVRDQWRTLLNTMVILLVP